MHYWSAAIENAARSAVLLIPICDLKDNTKMREIGHRSHALRIISELIKGITKCIGQNIKRWKNTIMKEFLSNIIPNVFNRIDFGRVRGLLNQANILRNHQGFGMMPACLIYLHDNEIL